ncbi:MAG: hypothetical protein PHD19_03790 [Dechloromonas sp.]|nr:hypothetical protein [Dechloromonas sp.]
MATVEQLKKAHADSMIAVQVVERELESVVREWKAAIAAGKDDAAIDAVDDRRRLAERAVERRRVAEQAAHVAVVEAEQAELAKQKKAAADAFLRQHASMAALLDLVEDAAQAYAAAVAKLEAAQAGYFDAAVAAQQLGTKPAVTGLRQTLDLIGWTKKANGIPATLNARFC